MIQPFLFELGKNGEVHPNRPMKNKRRAKRQWRAKRMRNGHGKKERSVEGGRRSVGLIPFASWAQSSAVFPGQIKDLGLLATLLNYINPFSLVIYMNRKIDPSIYPIRFRFGYLKNNRFHSTFDSKNCA